MSAPRPLGAYDSCTLLVAVFVMLFGVPLLIVVGGSL